MPEWLKRFIDAQNAHRFGKDQHNGSDDFSDESIYGGELNPATIAASPETKKGKYKLAKSIFRQAKKEHKDIRRDIRKYIRQNGIFRTDESVQPFIDRIDNATSIIGSKNEMKKARDAYYSELDNPNGLLPQLYRYWSRHHGYQSKQNEDDFTFGSGADIIDLGRNVQRLTPKSKQSTALFNDFVENKYPSVLSAKTYKNSPERLIGDSRKFPVKNISIFGGIEDGKFRLDSLKNFDDATTIIPARNIKAGTPMISSIQIEDNNGQQTYRDWDKINELHTLHDNSFNNMGNLLREYWHDPGVQEGIAEEIDRLNEKNKLLQERIKNGDNNDARHRRWMRYDIRSNKKDINFFTKVAKGKMPHGFLFDVRARRQSVASRYPKIMSAIPISQYFQTGEPTRYKFTDVNGNEHFVSEYNASVLDGKTIIGNPNGSIFIGRMRDVSRPQLDSINNYLKNNPSWIMRTDLGSYDQYRLDSPSLKSYLDQYLEHPDPSDPNVYTVGTTEPNKLWESNGNAYQE